MSNMCSYGHVEALNTNHTSSSNIEKHVSIENTQNPSRSDNDHASNITNNELFSINGDILEVFGISINIDDLIILIMLFFMFRENQVDYSIIIILALILFDQS